MDGAPQESSGISRRSFMRSAVAAAAAIAWAPTFRIVAGSAEDCVAPTGFPPGINLYKQAYENWAREIVVDDVWTCAPRDPSEVLEVVNWARAHGFRVRAQGTRHGFSPLTVAAGDDCANVVLLDMTQHLTGMTLHPGDPPSVTVQAGASMESLLWLLQDAGYGVTACPAPGVLTVGGVLAIGGHGTAIPATGEQRMPGHTYGSISNLVLSITAVVWDGTQQRYVLRTFDRSDRACAALLVHLGRTIITEVTLQTGANQRLRCESIVDIPATELFAAPGTQGARTISTFLDEAGRMEVIAFPFTESPWLKVWSVAPEKPASARAVNEPYNYPFSDNIPEPLQVLADDMIRNNPEATPVFAQMSYDAVRAGLLATMSTDIWGHSKDVLLYVRPTTLRVTTNGYVVHTDRASVQRVLADFWVTYAEMLEAYRARGSYPINMPLEVRVTGLDDPSDVEAAGARAPLLSALAPYEKRRGFDVAVWFNVLTFPGTTDAPRFFRELETWLFEHYRGWAEIRPEWSKGWAYTDEGAWADDEMLDRTIPDAFRHGRGRSRRPWDEAVQRLRALDPHEVISNDLVDRLL